MDIDIRVTELLASKLCHDLISPVSAINNGVELIEDIGGSVVDEAMKLIGNSAITASRRLRLFRLAYGRAGNDEGVSLKDVRLTAEQHLQGGKISLQWPEDEPGAILCMRRGFLKTILNMILLAEEILPYGGAISLHSASEGERAGCRFNIAGRNAHMSDMHQSALEGKTPIEDLTPRSIQAYITGQFAVNFGLTLTHASADSDQLNLILWDTEEIAQTLDADALIADHGKDESKIVNFS